MAETPGTAQTQLAPVPPIASLPPEWQRAFGWIERELGGRVVRAERQARWRPAWFLDLEREGGTLPLYFRGDRGEADHGVYPLEHELRVLQLLEEQGIPVPHVHGFCPEPRGIVMQRCPGRANLASAESDAEREAVLDHYMELLARMHALDVAPFEAAGLARPKSPRELALGDFDAWEAAYRRHKCRPEPLIEFAIGWLRRHAPEGGTRVSILAGDSGQFLFDAGRVTAILDLELAYLGDPAADLAGLRCRDLSEPLGDLARAFRVYADHAGEAPDPRVVDYHTARFALCTPMVVAHLVARPSPHIDPVQYRTWYQVYSRAPLEVMARLSGVELDPAPVPDATPSVHSPAHGALRGLLEGFRNAGSDPYQSDVALRLAAYLERAEQMGPAAEAADLDEAAALLGHRPKSWRDADRALEGLVAEADPGRDPELLRYFHRKVQRQEAILHPVMRELADAKLRPID